MRRWISWCVPAMLLSAPAFAVPAQLGWQGRMLDGAGQPVAGALDVTFRLLNAPTGGDTVWQETQSVSFQQGYYAIVLGADEAGNPLEDAALEQWPLFLEVQVAGRPPMFPRSELSSVPFARVAGTATHLQGGTVDAASVSVGGQPVIDSTGQWVGPTPPVDFADVAGVPADVADGDDDALGALSCGAGAIPRFDAVAGAWTCSADLAPWTCADGQILKRYQGVWVCAEDASTSVGSGSFYDLADVPAGLADGDGDTLAGLSCNNGQLPVWDAASARWLCGLDRDTFAGFSCAPGQVLKAGVGGTWACGADADTAVTEAEVDAFVANNGYARAAELATVAFSGRYADLVGVPSGLVDGDDDTLAALSCLDGQAAVWDAAAGAWACGLASDTFAGFSCDAGQVLKADGAGGWACGNDANTPITEAEVDAFVANNGYARLSELATVGTSGRFADLLGVPTGLADGDNDTLAGLSCTDGQRPVWDAASVRWLCGLDRDTFAGFSCAAGQVLKANGTGGWACGSDADTAVTEAEVDAFVANNGYALSASLARVASTGRFADLLSIPAGLSDGDNDTLAGLSCFGGEVPVWDAVLLRWSCTADQDSFAAYTCSVGQFLRYTVSGWQCATPASVTEAEVDAFVANNGYALATNLATVATTGAFSSLTGVPAGLADGDNDTLAGLSCTNGQLAVWDSASARWLCGVDRDTFAGFSCAVGQILKRGAGGWACGADADTAVTEAEVDAFVANNGYALATNLATVATTGAFSSLTGVPAGLADGDNDTLAGLSCTDGQVAVWDAASVRWLCGVDRDTFAGFSCSVGQILKRGAGGWACGSDADTAVTEAEVDAFVANNGYALAANLAPVATTGAFASLTGVPTGLADGDNDALRNLVCAGGQIPVFNASSMEWSCGNDTDTTLSQTEVRAFVEGMLGLALQGSTTVGGSGVLTQANHATNADAHHSSTSAGLNITPSTVQLAGTGTALRPGALDLGDAANDELTAQMVATLTGGGNADALHTHAATGGGGACYTRWGQSACGSDETTSYSGYAIRERWHWIENHAGDVDMAFGAMSETTCVALEALSFSGSTYPNPGGYAAAANTALGTFELVTFTGGRLTCAVCCR